MPAASPAPPSRCKGGRTPSGAAPSPARGACRPRRRRGPRDDLGERLVVRLLLRMTSAETTLRPASIIVANCREKTWSERCLTFLRRPPDVSSPTSFSTRAEAPLEELLPRRRPVRGRDLARRTRLRASRSRCRRTLPSGLSACFVGLLGRLALPHRHEDEPVGGTRRRVREDQRLSDLELACPGSACVRAAGDADDDRLRPRVLGDEHEDGVRGREDRAGDERLARAVHRDDRDCGAAGSSVEKSSLGGGFSGPAAFARSAAPAVRRRRRTPACRAAGRRGPSGRRREGAELPWSGRELAPGVGEGGRDGALGTSGVTVVSSPAAVVSVVAAPRSDGPRGSSGAGSRAGLRGTGLRRRRRSSACARARHVGSRAAIRTCSRRPRTARGLELLGRLVGRLDRDDGPS